MRGRHLAASFGLARIYDRVAALRRLRAADFSLWDRWLFVLPFVSFVLGISVLMTAMFGGVDPAGIAVGLILAGFGPIGLMAFLSSGETKEHAPEYDPKRICGDGRHIWRRGPVGFECVVCGAERPPGKL